jgi:hypothetical protein
MARLFRPPTNIKALRRSVEQARLHVRACEKNLWEAQYALTSARPALEHLQLELDRANGLTPAQASALVTAYDSGEVIKGPAYIRERLRRLGYITDGDRRTACLTGDGRSEAVRLRELHPELRVKP